MRIHELYKALSQWITLVCGRPPSSHSVLLSLEKLLQGSNLFEVDKWVEELFQIVCVIIKVQYTVFHEGSNELSCQLYKFVLVFIIFGTLLNILDHEKTEWKSDIMGYFDDFVETRQCVNSVDTQWWLKKGFKIISDNRVVTKFRHEQDSDIWIVLNDLH